MLGKASHYPEDSSLIGSKMLHSCHAMDDFQDICNECAIIKPSEKHKIFF